MAQAILHDTRSRAIKAGDDGMLARLRKGLADYRLYRATLHELSSLTDRELSDLGIHRSMIHEIARDSVYGA